MMDKTQRLRGVLGSPGGKDIADRYDDWASKYEADMASAGYRTPVIACSLFARHVPTDNGPVLDAGAGTGLGADNLRLLGYEEIHGVDASARMLDAARKKNLYASLHEIMLGEDPLPFEDDTFAGVIGLGILIPGHAPPDALDELVRVTKPGGVLVYNTGAKEYEASGFKAKHDALEKAGKWEFVEAPEPFRSVPLAVDSFQSLVVAYRVK